MKDFSQPVPMLMMPAPYVQIIIEAPQPAAQVVMVSPWPGLPTPDGIIGWQCCDAGPEGHITAVVMHVPSRYTDPAFTVRVLMGEDEVQHVVDDHGFYAT